MSKTPDSARNNCDLACTAVLSSVTPSHSMAYHKFSGLAVPINRTGLTLTVLVATIDAQWEGMGDVGSARYEPALLPPCPTIRVLSYSN